MPNDPSVPDVSPPARSIPPAALAFGARNADATFVDAAHPLPVAQVLVAAGSTPFAGTIAETGVAGPFTPVPGRSIWLTLAGTWSGSVQVRRSVDEGATSHPLTAGGEAWGAFTANACEQVALPTEAGESYYLDVTLASGELAYRLAQ